MLVCTARKVWTWTSLCITTHRILEPWKQPCALFYRKYKMWIKYRHFAAGWQFLLCLLEITGLLDLPFFFFRASSVVSEHSCITVLHCRPALDSFMALPCHGLFTFILTSFHGFTTAGMMMYVSWAKCVCVFVYLTCHFQGRKRVTLVFGGLVPQDVYQCHVNIKNYILTISFDVAYVIITLY